MLRPAWPNCPWQADKRWVHVEDSPGPYYMGVWVPSEGPNWTGARKFEIKILSEFYFVAKKANWLVVM